MQNKENKQESILLTNPDKSFKHRLGYHPYKVYDGDGTSPDKYIEKKRSKVLIYVLLVALLFAACWFFITIPDNIDISQLWSILGQLFVPSKWSLKTNDQWWNYLWTIACPQIWQTVEMVFISTIIGTIISVPLYILASRNINRNNVLRNIVKVIVNIFRTIPTFVLAIIATIFFGFNETAGVVAMALFTVGVIFKLMYEYVETVDMNPFEASISCGASRLGAYKTSIDLQVMPTFISNVIYVFEINIRASVVLGFVGAGGIGQLLSDAIESTQYDKVGAILVPLFVVVLFLQLLSSY